MYKRPFLKQTEMHVVKRWKVNGAWSLPLFTSAEGKKLIKQIIEWAKQGKEEK